MRENNQIALLIDAENIEIKYIDAIMKEVANYGRLVISRFYGDVYTINKEWSKKAIDYAIKPMHQYNVASGKNAADMAMALDAMEIMYQEKVDTIFIVSSDSDFTPLSSKLRESGMYVVGIGKEAKVTKAFKSSCNEFKYFDYLVENDHDPKVQKEVVKEQEDKDIDFDSLTKIIKDIIIENSSNSKVQLSRVGDILVNRYSDFDSRKYGAKQLSSLIRTIPGLTLTKENTTYYIEVNNSAELEEISQEIRKIISKNTTKRMVYPKLIQEIRKAYPDFDYTNYGYNKFRQFLNSIDGLNTRNSQYCSIK